MSKLIMTILFCILLIILGKVIQDGNWGLDLTSILALLGMKDGLKKIWEESDE